MNYEFHEQREKFPKPDWWVNADFHDTIPWGTTEFLDLYPEPIDDGVSQVDSKSKDTAEADRREKGDSTSRWMVQKRQTIHFELDALNHLDSDLRRTLHSWSVAPELHGGWR